MVAKIRSPICTVVGHVDHGKSSILDKIRGSAIVAQEAGGITQAIGASIIPLSTIKKICGPLLESLKINFTIPGLLFIDTPGHAAFTNLRKRGGNLADIAVLVVDIKEGFMPQTVESVEILKSYKTPFIVAANKIDLIKGWRQGERVIPNIQNQQERIITEFETKLYALVSSLSELGLNSDRFDRVDDFTKQIAIVPCSAKTGEGIPELLMVISGLAQRYLGERLLISSEGARGTILEVKEEKGLGKTMDVILYDGSLKIGDTIVIGGIGNPIVARVRALFEPAPLTEMRGEKTKFRPVKEAVAATGVKISAPGAEEALGGMPLISVPKEKIEEAKAEVQKSVEEVIVTTGNEGVVIKADNLGSLEALSRMLKEKGIGVIKASIGNVTKKDVSDAESNIDKNPLNAAVLGFNVEIENESAPRAKIIINKVIYKLIEDFEQWRIEEKQRMESGKLGNVMRPCKILVLRGYLFRQSNPAIIGCEILEGEARTGISMMNSKGKQITAIKEIQLEKENVTTAKRGMQVAMSFEGVTVGRQLNEGDILYSDIPEEDFRQLKKLAEYLSDDEKRALKEIAEIRRKENSVWGI